MDNQSLVKFKIKKTDLYVILNAEEPFEDVLFELKEKLVEAKRVFKNDKTNIFFSGRELSEEEEDIIYNAIEESSLNIITFGNEMYYTQVKTELIISEEAVLEKSKNLEEESDPQRQATFFQNGTMRSGRKIDFEGSVVLLGDLNVGTEIIATGNIVILGALKGLAHAGSRGDSNAYIYAKQFSTKQIRISEIVSILEPENDSDKVPSYAYTSEGKIFLAKI